MCGCRFALCLLSASLVCRADARPAPRPALAERLAAEDDVIGIVHWGINTFTDREWGNGDEDPALLDPSAFDADQIVSACRQGGLKGLVVVAKHHDGFCLWPTKTTPHNISRSPFRGGKGDYVREMSEACRRAGVRFGIYCSPWDRNNALYAKPEYLGILREQIRELLDGSYGEVFEMWFDSANAGKGWYGGANESRKITVDYYRYNELFAFVRRLQPKVTIFNENENADFRWGANERGFVDSNSRATAGRYDGVYVNYREWANVGVKDGVSFHPVEADFPLRHGWFFHEKNRGRTKSGAYLMQRYLICVGNAATMNIGIAPDKRGLLDDEDVVALREFGRLQKAFFTNEVTQADRPFNMVVMREDVSKGELVDGWEFLADGKTLLSGESIGTKRIRLLSRPLIATNVCVRITAQAPGKTRVNFRRYLVNERDLALVMGSSTTSGETDVVRDLTAVLERQERKPVRK